MVPGILIFRWVQMPDPERAHAKLLAFGEGPDIATVYIGNAQYHANLAEVIKDGVGTGPLLAAADVSRQGEVTGWKSSGFAFETPEVFREPVLQLLREHRHNIQDNWAK